MEVKTTPCCSRMGPERTPNPHAGIPPAMVQFRPEYSAYLRLPSTANNRVSDGCHLRHDCFATWDRVICLLLSFGLHPSRPAMLKVAWRYSLSSCVLVPVQPPLPGVYSLRQTFLRLRSQKQSRSRRIYADTQMLALMTPHRLLLRFSKVAVRLRIMRKIAGHFFVDNAYRFLPAAFTGLRGLPPMHPEELMASTAILKLAEAYCVHIHTREV